VPIRRAASSQAQAEDSRDTDGDRGRRRRGRNPGEVGRANRRRAGRRGPPSIRMSPCAAPRTRSWWRVPAPARSLS
jgi:hypothetical protein